MMILKIIPVVIPAAILHPMRPSPLVCPELSTYTRFTGSYAPILQREFKVSAAIVAVVVIIAIVVIVAIVVIIIIRPDGRESHLPLQAGHNPTVQGGSPLVPHYRDQSSQLRVLFVYEGYEHDEDDDDDGYDDEDENDECSPLLEVASLLHP